MSEQGWREFLAAEGVDDWVVLHGGATAVFRVPSLGEAAQLAEAVAQVVIDGERVSSGRVREALAAGDLAWPRTAFGRRYAVDGEVVSGAGRGKGLGYPTANLQVDPLRSSSAVVGGRKDGMASPGAVRRVSARSTGRCRRTRCRSP